MVISEKILHNSLHEVCLYKEGVFWIAYEQSAYMVSLVKELKATKKLVKKLNKEVISVGFPDSSLDKTISMFRLTERRDTMVIMEADSPCDVDAFLKWKDCTEISVPHSGASFIQQPAPLQNDNETGVTERLLAFDIGNSTPVECFLFLNELQQSIIKK